VCLSQSFNDYFNVNHSRLLSLWRTAVTFRHQFTDLKETTDRELATLRAEITRLSRGVNSACLNLSTQLHTTDLGHQVSSFDLLFTSQMLLLAIRSICKLCKKLLDL